MRRGPPADELGIGGEKKIISNRDLLVHFMRLLLSKSFIIVLLLADQISAGGQRRRRRRERCCWCCRCWFAALKILTLSLAVSEQTAAV